MWSLLTVTVGFQLLYVVFAQSCSPNGLTRLSTFDYNTYAGIVEVCLNGTWGTVCADSPNTLWSEKNAQVFCQGRGFSGALNPVDQSTLPSKYAVNPATPINYKAVRCNGTETSLSQCSHSETTTGCTHASDAAVVCRQSVSDGDVRLVGSPTNGQGAVEIYDEASLQWYRVCPTGWTSSYASMVCQQLGYKTGVSNTYSLNTGMLQKVSAYCTSPKCYVYFAYTTCSSPANSYAGVICTSASSSSGAVRLSGGSRPSVGRVEVLYNGVWGTVCTYGPPWTLTEGQVVCTQLGYKNLSTISVSPTESLSALSSLYPIWLNGINCISQKTNITQCGYTKPIGYGLYCTHYYDAIVDCESTSGSSSSSLGALGALGVVVVVPVAAARYSEPICKFLSHCVRCLQCFSWVWLQSVWVNLRLLLCCCFLTSLVRGASREHLIQQDDVVVQVVTTTSPTVVTTTTNPPNSSGSSSKPESELIQAPPPTYAEAANYSALSPEASAPLPPPQYTPVPPPQYNAVS
eukprot:Em0005g808a